MNAEIKTLIWKSIETAKEDLRRDGYLLPVAFIVMRDDQLDFNLEFEGAEQKASVYAELVKMAKEKNAQAIITINDARCGSPVAEIGECIYATISGPRLETWTVTVPYFRVQDEIVFGPPTEAVADRLNFFRDWP